MVNGEGDKVWEGGSYKENTAGKGVEGRKVNEVGKEWS